MEDKSPSLLTSEVVCDELPNGIKVLVKQVYPARVANFGVWVRVGAVNETDRVAGISHFIEHMLFKGTEKRPVGQIAKEIHGCGGYTNAFTDYECTCYWVVLPSKYLDVALDIHIDAFLHSTFDEVELQKECQVILEELKMYQDRPDAYSFEKLMTLAYKKHPYGRPIIGSEQTLRQMTRKDLLEYLHEHYYAENMFITLIGDIEPTRAIRKIKNAFKGIPRKTVQRTPLPVEPAQTEFRKERLSGDIARSYLNMAFHVPEATHEDLHALKVLATILGEGRSSRLSQTLREKEQLVDYAQAGVFAQQHPGFFYLSFMLEELNMEKVENGAWREIKKLQDQLVLPDELLKAQNMTESDYIFSQETVEGQGRNLGNYEMLGDYSLGEKLIKKIFAVTPHDIQRAAQKYFTRNNCSEIEYRRAEN